MLSAWISTYDYDKEKLMLIRKDNSLLSEDYCVCYYSRFYKKFVFHSNLFYKSKEFRGHVNKSLWRAKIHYKRLVEINSTRYTAQYNELSVLAKTFYNNV